MAGTIFTNMELLEVAETKECPHPLPVNPLWRDPMKKDPSHYECKECGAEFEAHLLKMPKF